MVAKREGLEVNETELHWTINFVKCLPKKGHSSHAALITGSAIMWLFMNAERKNLCGKFSLRHNKLLPIISLSIRPRYWFGSWPGINQRISMCSADPNRFAVSIKKCFTALIFAFASRCRVHEKFTDSLTRVDTRKRPKRSNRLSRHYGNFGN